MEAALSESRRPGWQGIADALTASGFVKPDGKAITAVYARQTWWRVCRHGRRQTVSPRQLGTAPLQIPDDAGDHLPTFSFPKAK